MKIENVTLGQIALGLAFIVGIITSTGFLIKHIKDWINQAMSDQLEAIKSEFKAVSAKVDNVDMESCKNYLVVFLSGVDKGNTVDEIEKERFYEQFQHYSSIGGNSYIKRKVEQLEAEGKL